MRLPRDGAAGRGRRLPDAIWRDAAARRASGRNGRVAGGEGNDDVVRAD